MRSSAAGYLVIDLETVPDTTRWTRPEPIAPGPGAPLRGPSGAPGPGAPQRSPSTEAWPPNWAQQVVVIGCLWLDHAYRLRKFDALTGAEPALLATFSAAVVAERPTLVTYNGRGFDFPVLVARSLCHGVPQPWYYRDRNVRARYADDGHLDLCDWLADHGAARAGKLDALARLIGLPGKVGIDGSQVEPLVAAGELGKVVTYCLGDVAQTALLFLRFRLIQGTLSPADYRERARALVADLAASGQIPEVIGGIDNDRLLL